MKKRKRKAEIAEEIMSGFNENDPYYKEMVFLTE